MSECNTLFDIDAFESAGFKAESERPVRYCRTCVHRFRAQTDDHSTKWEQYCEKFPPKRKNTVGRMKIKVTNHACGYYQERKL